MKESKRQYSREEKKELLLMIDKMGSLAAVEKATGVARATLRRWGDEMANEMSEYKELMTKGSSSNLAVAIEAQTLCNHAAFLGKAFTIKNEALIKLQSLIQKSNNLRDVTGALNVLHAITLTENPDDPTANTSRSLYEQVLGMCPSVTNVQINHYGKD